LSLIRRIRRLPPERGGRVPAVALTAYTLRDEADDPIRAGFQIHLQKPIESRVLVEAVADLARG
jgi:CheY-like chemotaxis protein